MTDRATDRQRRVWAQHARSYDRQIALVERLLFPHERRWLAQRARGRVLELAIGTGLSLPFYPADASVVGVDVSPEMLQHAAQRAAVAAPDVTFLEADAMHLPMADGAFDTVLCALAMCCIPDRMRTLQQAYRVLTPGGRLLLLDHGPSTWPPIAGVQWLAEQVSRRLAGEHLTRRSLPLLARAGFDLVEHRRTRAGIVEVIHARRPG